MSCARKRGQIRSWWSLRMCIVRYLRSQRRPHFAVENKRGPEGPLKRAFTLPLLYKVVSLAVGWSLSSQTEVCFVCT